MNETPRNPYRPTSAPLIEDDRPRNGGSPPGRDYAGFWVRFGALFVDGLILLPLGVVQYFGIMWSMRYFVYAYVPLMIFNAFYWMYLVKAFGGTPGKRVLKLRIEQVDGTPVTGAAAIIRNAPLFVLSQLSGLGQLLAAWHIVDSDVEGLGYLGRIRTLNAGLPSWASWVGFAMALWMLVTTIFLLSNYRKRALHDFLAGTVVIRER